MATASSIQKPSAADSPIGEQRYLLRNVGWEGYEALLEWFGDDAPRMTYANGDVEFMSPHVPHEERKKLLAFMVETIAEEFGIDFRPLASVTFEKRSVGRLLEPDECYYFGANAARVTSRKRVDLDVDPPADLCIEVEITNSLIDKLDVYARMGFPEIWRFDGEALTVLLLDAEGRYTASDRSASLAFVSMGDLVDRLHEYVAGDDRSWRRRFRAWVRGVLAPRHQDYIREA